ncbi:MAG: acetyl-CoA synthetase, partial [Planctomycetota bacterium JB042]
MSPIRLVLLAVLLVATPAAAAPEEARLLRFPHVQGDKLAFVHAGDVWTVPLAGGEARRLTSFDDGIALFPRISPDGTTVAYSGERSGTRQVYVVPYAGGVPRRLTFYPDVGRLPPRGGYDNLVYDWTPDGEKLLVRSNRTPYGERIGKYFLVDPNGGLPTPLPIPEGGPATFSPDGKKIAYCIISREWRTWKRYRAGRAQDVWIYDLETDSVERLTTFEGTDNQPLWIGETIYFTSDRTGTLNLYACDLATRDIRAVTTYDDFDVLFPSRGAGGLVFERAGWIWFMDAETEAIRKVQITFADDRPWLRPRWIEGDGHLDDWAVSPSGKRAIVTVRGDVFTVPAEKGEPHRITRTPARR